MEESPDPQTSVRRTSDCETVTHWAAVPPIQTAGHTGYLTYASLCCSS